MALAETVIRKVKKLGLVPKAIAILPRLSLLVAALSVLWLVTLPQDGNYRNVYISENALMPAQANSYFRRANGILFAGIERDWKDGRVGVADRNEVIASWLVDSGLQISYHENGFANNTLCIRLCMLHEVKIPRQWRWLCHGLILTTSTMKVL